MHLPLAFTKLLNTPSQKWQQQQQNLFWSISASSFWTSWHRLHQVLPTTPPLRGQVLPHSALDDLRSNTRKSYSTAFVSFSTSSTSTQSYLDTKWLKCVECVCNYPCWIPILSLTVFMNCFKAPRIRTHSPSCLRSTCSSSWSNTWSSCRLSRLSL